MNNMRCILQRKKIALWTCGRCLNRLAKKTRVSMYCACVVSNKGLFTVLTCCNYMNGLANFVSLRCQPNCDKIMKRQIQSRMTNKPIFQIMNYELCICSLCIMIEIIMRSWPIWPLLPTVVHNAGFSTDTYLKNSLFDLLYFQFSSV